MDNQQLRNEADFLWSSLPSDFQREIARIVSRAEMEGSNSWYANGVAINLTSSDSDHDSIAAMKRLSRAVGHPLVRVVNGENYFDLSGALVSVISSSSIFHADKNQLVLF
jgi:hypothetical protein